MSIYGENGFSQVSTGGDCSAMKKEIGAGLHVLVISTENEAMAPAKDREAVYVALCVNQHTDPLASFEAKNAREAIKKLNAGEWE